MTIFAFSKQFVVDGSQKADPKQPLVKDSTGQRTPTNYIDVIKKIAKSTTSATKSTELDIPNTASRNPSLKKPVGKGSSGSKTDDNETTDSSGEKSSNASSAAHPVKKHVRTLSKPSDTEEGSTGDFSELIAPEQQPTKSQAQKIRKIDDDNNFSSNSNTPNSGISSNSTAIRNKTKHERMPSNNSENNPEEEEEEEERESLEEETSLLTPKQHWINDIAARDYTQEERVFVETKKTMPIVPPHLKYTPLNSSKKYSHDTCLLPVPLHVTVNHAYMKKAPDMQVFGITQRFQGKYSTLVFFKPNNENNPPS